MRRSRISAPSVGVQWHRSIAASRRTREVLAGSVFGDRRERRTSRRAVERYNEWMNVTGPNNVDCRFGGPDPTVPAERADVLVPTLDEFTVRPSTPLPDFGIGERALVRPLRRPRTIGTLRRPRPFPEEGRKCLQRLGGLSRENQKGQAEATMLAWK